LLKVCERMATIFLSLHTAQKVVNRGSQLFYLASIIFSMKFTIPVSLWLSSPWNSYLSELISVTIRCVLLYKSLIFSYIKGKSILKKIKRQKRWSMQMSCT
jgi:hypothetical protein